MSVEKGDTPSDHHHKPEPSDVTKLVPDKRDICKAVPGDSSGAGAPVSPPPPRKKK